MTVDILITTETALSRLHTAGNLKVHSVYQKTVNLLCDGRLLSLHPESTPLSPIGMLTDTKEAEFSSFPFSAGSRVTFQQTGFSIRNTFFSLKNAKIEKSSLISISEDREKVLSRMISDALRSSEQNTVFCDLLLDGEEFSSSAPAVYAQQLLINSQEQLSDGDLSSAGESLTRLIGLGAGLTPSGDDFLCGVLAALTMRDSSPELHSVLKMKILEKLSRTNDISAEFLRCACEGHFSQSITELPYADNTDEILKSFSKIGHSSGADTLNGLLFLFSQTDRHIQ